MTDETRLEQITHRIVERFHPRGIILFGSHVRGEATPDSDLGIFVETETQERPRGASQFSIGVEALVIGPSGLHT